jgi:hypothetical protein
LHELPFSGEDEVHTHLRCENPAREFESKHKISRNNPDLHRMKSMSACRSPSTKFEWHGVAQDEDKTDLSESKCQMSEKHSNPAANSVTLLIEKSQKYLLTEYGRFPNLGVVGSP